MSCGATTCLPPIVVIPLLNELVVMSVWESAVFCVDRTAVVVPPDTRGMLIDE